MKPILAALAATGLAFAATPALADDHDDMMEMSTEQRTMYDTWPADRRMAYDNWPADAQTYYWTLSPMQTETWWMLNDQQRVQLVALTPQQRDRAWTAMMQRQGNMAQTTTAPATTGTMPRGNMNTGNIRFVSNAVVQNAPPPHNGEYPVCENDMQDNCMNAWEAGRRGPGVDRPLDYWPGQPASSM